MADKHRANQFDEQEYQQIIEFCKQEGFRCQSPKQIVPSFSRPSVSNDNAYSEALFKILKFAPRYPSKPFKDIEKARKWVMQFVQ
ncbi:MAG: hypothetical protein ABW139_06730 [Candidatus Thiodiazotropha sp. DIVDIV]